MKKKALSLLLALTMCLTALTPAAALGADAPEQTVSEGQETPAGGQDASASEGQEASEEPEAPASEEEPASGEQEKPVSEEEQSASEEPEAPASEEEQETRPAEEEPEQTPAAEPVLLAAASGIAAYSGEHTHPICGASCTDGAHTDITDWTAWGTGDTPPTEAGSYYLTGPVTLDETWKPAGGTVLCLNGNTVTASFEGTAIELDSGAAFTVTDCQSGGKITHAKNKTGRGVNVGSGSTFTMYGGAISDNTIETENGGGVFVEGGTFDLYGGKVTGNTAANGGGVYLNGGAFSMSGGTVGIVTNNDENNYAKDGSGGGVYIQDGTFTMSGGTIGAASDGIGLGNYANGGYGGGGVCAAGGTFEMTGGSIVCNSVAYDKDGAGVYVGAGVTFRMSGGSIARNTIRYGGDNQSGFLASTGRGSGVYAGESIYVSGSASIIGNNVYKLTENNGKPSTAYDLTIGDTYLPDGKLILVESALTGEKNYISVMPENPAENVYSIAAKGSGSYELTADDAAHITGVISAKVAYDAERKVVVASKDAPHSRPICGNNETTCPHSDGNGGTMHENVLWWPISDLSQIDTTSGHYYYLTQNVDLTEPWTPADGVYLDLGGFSITQKTDGKAVIEIGSGVTLTLTDCRYYTKHGQITHGENASGCGVHITGKDSLLRGALVMYGGKISGNRAENGGGVYNEGGTFTMYGGTVSNNTAGANGGGICAAGSGSSKSQNSLLGGRIIDNTAACGGGVYVGSGSPKIGGGVQITGNTAGGTASNVYLPAGSTLSVEYSSVTPYATYYSLSDTARVGVTMETEPSDDAPEVKFADSALDGNLKYSEIFTPDAQDQEYAVVRKNTYLYFSRHQHGDWTYAASGASIAVKCGSTVGACGLTGGVVGAYTVAAPADGLTYDGRPKAAEVTFAPAAGVTKPGDLPETLTVTYQKDGAAITGTPTDAGEYTAGIALGGETASVDYTIGKATLTADDFIFTAPTDLVYTGEEQTVSGDRFTLTGGRTGAGAVTARCYDGSGAETALRNAGIYTVGISVEDGTNYNAAEDLTASGWTLSVAKADPIITAAPAERQLTKNGVEVDISNWASFTNTDSGTALIYTLDGAPAGITLTGNMLKAADSASTVSTFRIKVNAAATANFNAPAEQIITVTVTDKTAADLPGGVTQEDMTYNGGQTALPDPVYTAPGGSTVTVTYAGTLRDGTGYAAAADKPTQAGAYTVTVTCETADAIYTASAQFAIEPIDLGDGNHGVGFSSPRITYAGEEDWTGIYPMGPNGAPQMTKDQDYRITGTTTAVNVGEYTVTIEGIGNNYTGAVSGTWAIIPAKLTVSGAAVKPKTYDGTADAVITGVTFTGLKGSDALTLGTDYQVTGAKFNSPNAADADTVAFTVTLLGTAAAKNYELTGADCGTAASIAQAAAPAAQDGALTVVNGLAREYTFDFKTLLPKLDGEKSYGGVTYGGLPGVQFDPGYYNFDAAMSNGVLTLPILANSVTTTGRVGTVTVTVTTGNYEDITLTLIVSAANQRVPTGEPVLSKTTLTYGDALSTIALSGAMKYNGADVPGTFAWADGTVTPGAGAYQAGWKFTPDDGAYAEVTGTADITVEKAVPTGEPKYTRITSGGKTLKDAGLTAEGGTFSVSGTVKWVDKNGNELAETTEVKANTEYQWKFFPADAANYESISGSIKLYTVSGGGGGGGASVPTYPVSSSNASASAAVGGSVSISTKNAAAGSTVTVTVSPDAGYRLGKLTVVDKNGKEIEVTEKDGKYTFTMPASQVEIRPVFEKIPAETVETAFPDVPANAYYADAVKWAAEKGITSGTRDGGFAPGNTCTRAQIVTFLWRAAGSPEPKGTAAGMTDVAADSYYAKAVAWAIENGITVGKTDTTFDPNGTCTRANGVTFLYRAAKAAAGGDTGFRDVAADAYYAAAVRWALENGITNGLGSGLFGPDGGCTRAQIVTFLYRLYVKA